MAYSKSALLILILQIIFPLGIFAEKIVLDLHSDQTGKWIEITCLYNDDYNDFWVYGFPVQLSGVDDVYPDKKGFWTSGTGRRCEMHYFGGEDMPKPKTLTIGMYVRGSPELLITSKSGPLDEEYTYDIGSIPDNGEEGWLETTIDLTSKRGFVFNFTLITLGEDLLLVDKIEFDLGEDVTTPAPPTEPTTIVPIVDDVLTLDTDKDYWIVWDQNCHYVSDTAYLWAFGCPPVNPKEDDTQIGYWNTCSASRACSLTFYGGLLILSGIPEAIRIRSYVDGGAKINITAQNNVGGSVCEKECSVLGVLDNTGGKWTEVTLPVNITLKPQIGYIINIELVPSEEGTILVDKIELLISQNITTTTTADPGSTSTTEGSSGSSSTPTTANPGSTSTTEGSSGSSSTTTTANPGSTTEDSTESSSTTTTDPGSTTEESTESSPRTTEDSGPGGSSAPGITESKWVLASSLFLIITPFLLKI